MRFIICFLGLVGSLLAGFFGWFWLDHVNSRELVELARDYGVDLSLLTPEYNVDYVESTNAAVFLLAGMALGMLGSAMTLVRRGRQGAVLMILAVLGPALFTPVTLVFNAVLAFAGLLSIFIRPRRAPAVEAA